MKSSAVCICLLDQSCCSDLFAASYGSFDFYSQPNLGNHTFDYWTIVRVKFCTTLVIIIQLMIEKLWESNLAQPWWSLNAIDYSTILIVKFHKCAGYVCLFSLKNPSYPEYICKANSGVSEKQLVKLISVWNNKVVVNSSNHYKLSIHLSWLQCSSGNVSWHPSRLPKHDCYWALRW